MNAESVVVTPHEGGRLISAEGTPIGLITAGGAIMTPAGATCTVEIQGGSARLVSADGHAMVVVSGATLRDEKTGVEWRVREGWEAAFRNGAIGLDDIWALPYSLEEAQGTVPNRVKLLLAWMATQSEA